MSGQGNGARPHVVVACSAHRLEAHVGVGDLERLREHASVSTVTCEGGELSTELRRELARAVAVVMDYGAPVLTREALADAPRLRLVGDLGGDRTGRFVDLEAARERGLVLVDTGNSNAYALAEWTLGLMLNGLRNAGAHFRRLIAGERVPRPYGDPGIVHGELGGKRVGLIGCGFAGRRLLALLRPFGVRVAVYDPYLAPELADALEFERTDSLERLVRESEVVVCLAPLTPATAGMIGARELEWLSPNAVFVNTSRGGVVDSAALIARLKRGLEVGDGVRAALDVFDPEPIPEDGALAEIRALPNVFLSPHLAGVTGASGPRRFRLMVDELRRFFSGYTPRYAITPEALESRAASA